MTTERQQVAEPAAAQDDFVVVDNTPAEVDAAIDAAVPVRAPASAPQPQTEAPPPAEAAPAPVEIQTPAAPETKPAAPAQPTYTQEQWSKMRQSMQERENAARQEAVAQRKELDDIKARLAAQDMEAQVEAYRRQAQADLEARNFDPAQAAAIANNIAAERRVNLKAESDRKSLEARLQAADAEANYTAQIAAVRILAGQYGIEQDDIPLLMGATPQTIIPLAQRLGREAQSRKAVTAAKVAAVPAVRVEAGGNAARPSSEYEASLARIDAGEATEADWERYRQNRNK